MLEVKDGNVKLPRLSYVEFFEALCRVAEVLSVVYRQSVLEQLNSYQRSQLPLFFKTEALIAELYLRTSDFRSRRMKNLVRSRTFDDLFLQTYYDNFRAPEDQQVKAKVNTFGAESAPSLADIMLLYKEAVAQRDEEEAEYEEI